MDNKEHEWTISSNQANLPVDRMGQQPSNFDQEFFPVCKMCWNKNVIEIVGVASQDYSILRPMPWDKPTTDTDCLESKEPEFG